MNFLDRLQGRGSYPGGPEAAEYDRSLADLENFYRQIAASKPEPLYQQKTDFTPGDWKKNDQAAKVKNTAWDESTKRGPQESSTAGVPWYMRDRISALYDPTQGMTRGMFGDEQDEPAQSLWQKAQTGLQAPGPADPLAAAVTAGNELNPMTYILRLLQGQPLMNPQLAAAFGRLRSVSPSTIDTIPYWPGGTGTW